METKTKEEIQEKALKKFKSCHKGTICLSTGTGKSRIAINFIKETSDINLVLITSPRTNLQENWKKELRKWGLVDNINDSERWRIKGTERYVRIIIENIQSAYKRKNEKFDFIVADEIHTMMTPEYSSLFKNNEYKYIMGLTATHDITYKNDKLSFYEKYCPVIYEYYDSANDGIINKTKFFIVTHHLTDSFPVIIKTKEKIIKKGELEYYSYLTERIKDGQSKMATQNSDNWFRDAKKWFWDGYGTKEQRLAAMAYLNAITRRKKFLLNLPSTALLAKKIKEGILASDPNAKVLIFSELTTQADKITENTVHSNNHKNQNMELINSFNEGKIRDLGSCQSLMLGLNLEGATHAIMESYIGSATQSKQKKGRLDRLSIDNMAEMWIIKVSGTRGDKWFKEMTRDFDLSNAEYFDSKIFFENEFDFKNKRFLPESGRNDSTHKGRVF